MKHPQYKFTPDNEPYGNPSLRAGGISNLKISDMKRQQWEYEISSGLTSTGLSTLGKKGWRLKFCYVAKTDELLASTEHYIFERPLIQEEKTERHYIREAEFLRAEVAIFKDRVEYLLEETKRLREERPDTMLKSVGLKKETTVGTTETNEEKWEKFKELGFPELDFAPCNCNCHD